MKLYINGAAGRGRDKCQPPSLRPGKKYLALGSSWFVLGGERPASDFQLEQSSSFSFFLAFSLSSPFPALGELGESEKKKKKHSFGEEGAKGRVRDNRTLPQHTHIYTQMHLQYAHMCANHNMGTERHLHAHTHRCTCLYKYLSIDMYKHTGK